MESNPPQPINVFYCYARKDRGLRDELDSHLAGLRHSGLINDWYDGQISPGTSWEKKIETQLDAAQVILLLISSDFLASKYCIDKEMARAIERHQRGEARVIPILLRAVNWKDITSLRLLHMLPTNAKPIKSWPDRDEAFEDVVQGIRRVVNELHSHAVVPRPPEPLFPPPPPLHPSRRIVVVGLAVGLTTGTSILLWQALCSSVSPPTESKWRQNVPMRNAINEYISYSSPVVANRIAYVSSTDGHLYAFDARTGQLKWRSADTGSSANAFSSPTVANGIAYVGSADSHLYAFDARTGQLKWNFTTGNRIDSSPTIANGLVYVSSTDSHLYAFDAIKGPINGQSKWRSADTGSSTYAFSSPAVANDGIIYIGSWDGHLYAFDMPNTKPKWGVSINGASTGAKASNVGTFSSPTVANGLVYIGSTDGHLYAFDAMRGLLKWEASTERDIFSSPMVANGLVYIGSTDGHLYAFDAIKGPINGQPKWAVPVDGPISSSPAIANGLVYIGSDDNKIYAFDAMRGLINGQPKWKESMGNSSSPTEKGIYSSPTIADGIVYISSTDSYLYAFPVSKNT